MCLKKFRKLRKRRKKEILLKISFSYFNFLIYIRFMFKFFSYNIRQRTNKIDQLVLKLSFHLFYQTESDRNKPIFRMDENFGTNS